MFRKYPHLSYKCACMWFETPPPPLRRSQFSFTPTFTILGFQDLPPLSQSFHWPSRRWVWIFSRTALWLITGHKKSTHINGHIFIASLFKAILGHVICHLKNQLFTKNGSVWYTFVFNYCLKTFLINNHCLHVFVMISMVKV